MLARRILFSVPIFLVTYVLQESLFNQVRLPGGGFSIFLILTLVWAALSTPEVGAVTGFGAGFLMDISQNSDGPMGHWTLIMVATCYGIAFLAYGDDRSRANPLTTVILVVSGVFISEVIFLLSGALLGVNLGSFGQILTTLIGMSVWTLIVTPLVLPVFTKIHAIAFDLSSQI
jgi:rod shape-determining protein MreD